jgi:hypothetical protein
MKLDKDTLLKQRFWLVLIVSVPLAVAGIFILSSSVPAQIDKESKAVKTALDKVDGFVKQGPKSNKWVEQAEEIAKAKKKQETEVWKIAADEQAGIMTWPRVMEEKYHFRDGHFAKEIVVEARGKTEGKKEDAGQPAGKDEERHFSGTVENITDDALTVIRGKTKMTFLATADVKVTIPEVQSPGFQSVREGDRVKVTYDKGMYFGDKLTDNQQTFYVREYKSQIPEIIRIVQPVDAQGVGVVQFGNPIGAGAATWIWDGKALPPKPGVDGGQRFLRYVADEWKREQDISDEVWLAQEDLWIQRDIYRMIRVANDRVAVFEGEGGAEKDHDYVFTNPYWQITSRVTSEGNLVVKLKNLQDQRQYLSNLAFLFKLSPDANVPPRKQPIEGMPLAPAGAADGKDTVEKTFTPAQLGGSPPRGIFGVTQVLNWKTAAVKRLDNVRIGSTEPQDCAASHRHCAITLKKLRELREPNKKDPNAQDNNPLQGIVQAPAPNQTPQAQATGVPDDLSVNNLIQNRYMPDPGTGNPPARRLPVGVVLIVAQQHVERVLASFANSKLRFLTTQIVLNRYPDTVRPDIIDPNAQQVAGIFLGGRRPRVVYDPRNTPAPSTGGGGMSEEQESNVELCIYGIVTLYERFPPRLTTGLAP